jgi:hypothetical protein
LIAENLAKKYSLEIIDITEFVNDLIKNFKPGEQIKKKKDEEPSDLEKSIHLTK